MKLSTAINQATIHLLHSKKARTYTSYPPGQEYVLELERDPEEKTWLCVTTWGYDHEVIHIPQTRGELISLKCNLQLEQGRNGVEQVALRYYFDILRRESNG